MAKFSINMKISFPHGTYIFRTVFVTAETEGMARMKVEAFVREHYRHPDIEILEVKVSE